MNWILIIYLIGVALIGWFWLCCAYCEYKSYQPITLGHVVAAICTSLLSWFALLVPIALILRDNLTITLLKRKEK